MPAEILCSASCVSNAGQHIVAARATPQGQSILVWDLIGNQLTREIPYAPINPNARVTYINITPEDRLIVAGFNNPGTDQACFMVFDLAAEARVSIVLFLFQSIALSIALCTVSANLLSNTLDLRWTSKSYSFSQSISFSFSLAITYFFVISNTGYSPPVFYVSLTSVVWSENLFFLRWTTNENGFISLTN